MSPVYSTQLEDFLLAFNTTAILVGIGWAVIARRELEDRESEGLDMDRRIARLEAIVEAHGSCIKDGFHDDRALAERLGRLELLTGHAKQIPDLEGEDEIDLNAEEDGYRPLPVSR